MVEHFEEYESPSQEFFALYGKGNRGCKHDDDLILMLSEDRDNIRIECSMCGQFWGAKEVIDVDNE